MGWDSNQSKTVIASSTIVAVVGIVFAVLDILGIVNKKMDDSMFAISFIIDLILILSAYALYKESKTAWIIIGLIGIFELAMSVMMLLSATDVIIDETIPKYNPPVVVISVVLSAFLLVALMPGELREKCNLNLLLI